MNYVAQERSRLVEMRSRDVTAYIDLLESTLIEAEDVALYRGDWGLCDSRLDCGDIYPSQTCATLIDLARERATKHSIL